MAIVLEQQYAISSNVGDAETGDGKSDFGYGVAWPTAPTSGNTLIMWMAVNDGQDADPAPSGWTECGSPVVSPDHDGGIMQAWRRVADGTEPAQISLSQINGPGSQFAAGLMEFSGVGVYDKTTDSAVGSSSVTSATVMPSVSITPADSSGLIVAIGVVAEFTDAAQIVYSVSQTNSFGGGVTAQNSGVRLSSGDEHAIAGWQNYKTPAGSGAQSTVATITLHAGGTNTPDEGCSQKLIAFKAA